MPLHAAVALAAFTLSLTVQERPVAACSGAEHCRATALVAEAGRDFEAFHDLAWRAVQQGKRNDPELMLLLARAQSLSGRPLDALVMLGRLADLGIGGDIASGDEFRRVRALPGWPEIERRLLEAGKRGADAPPPSVTPEPKSAAVAAAPVEKTPDVAGTPKATGSARAPRFAASESLRFNAARLTPSGLAYDAVSRRFIVGDRQGRKLSVVDEFSHQVANLAGAQSAGFGEVTALEIDARDGTLWVVSAEQGKTTLHQMQLISGRLLASFPAPADSPASRFVDVAVGTDGAALVLDAGARRVWRLRRGARALETVGRLPDLVPTSIAPTPDGSIYVAHTAGISRLAPGNGGPAKLALPSAEFVRIVRIRWHGGALIAVEEMGGTVYRAVRMLVGRGGSAIAGIEVLDPSVRVADPAAISITGGALYYLSPADDGALSIRRVELPG